MSDITLRPVCPGLFVTMDSMDDPVSASTTAAARDLDILIQKLNSVELPPDLKEEVKKNGK